MNAGSEIDYFAHLARSMTALLNGVVRESAFALFRRSPEVVFGAPLAQMSPDFHLYITSRTTAESDKGTFNVPVPPDRFIVYRSPVRMSVSFALVARNVSAATMLRTHDKIYSYLFDNRFIEPFVPDQFRTKPGLYERLVAQKAELKIRNDEAPSLSTVDVFNFQFDYLALYHSGNALREEVRVKQRVIDYQNDSNERSVL